MLPGSSDPAHRGDPSRYNPEELLVASISACHMLWYLHLCADSGVVVTGYRDEATAVTKMKPDGSGCFTGQRYDREWPSARSRTRSAPEASTRRPTATA